MKKLNHPFVFWLKISIRKTWFSYWWKTRGANFLEFQVWIFRISIGMPWYQGYLDSVKKDYGSLNTIEESNKGNLKHWLSIKIG